MDEKYMTEQGFDELLKAALMKSVKAETEDMESSSETPKMPDGLKTRIAELIREDSARETAQEAQGTEDIDTKVIELDHFRKRGFRFRPQSVAAAAAFVIVAGIAIYGGRSLVIESGSGTAAMDVAAAAAVEETAAARRIPEEVAPDAAPMEKADALERAAAPAAMQENGAAAEGITEDPGPEEDGAMDISEEAEAFMAPAAASYKAESPELSEEASGASAYQAAADGREAVGTSMYQAAADGQEASGASAYQVAADSQEAAAAETQAAADAGVAQAAVPNPMAEKTSLSEIEAELSIDMSEPEGASDIRYYVIAGSTGQISYVSSEGYDCTYRAAKPAGADISGIYYELQDQEELEIEGVSLSLGFAETEAGASALLRWDLEDTSYSLYMEGCGDREAAIQEASKLLD